VDRDATTSGPAVPGLLPLTRRGAADRLVVPAALHADVCGQALRAWPLETGGVLLGHGRPGGAVVRAVVGAGPAATATTAGFDPDQNWQADAVAAAWRQDRSLEYLGDWHTHPRGDTSPSRTDRRVLLSIAGYGPARQPRPWMLIIAVSADGALCTGAVRHRPDGRVHRAVVTLAGRPAADAP
jgi:integrative and conjugative element protein (TIGR02256 family)